MVRSPAAPSRFLLATPLALTALAIAALTSLAPALARADTGTPPDIHPNSGLPVPRATLASRLDSLGQYFLNQKAVAGFAIAVAHRVRFGCPFRCL